MDQDLLKENEKQHEEYEKLLQEIKELCHSLEHKFEEYGEHMSRYADKMNKVYRISSLE